MKLLDDTHTVTEKHGAMMIHYCKVTCHPYRLETLDYNRGEVNAKTTKKMENAIMVQVGFRDVRNDLHPHSSSRLSSKVETTTF
jgi:hypothetical protein